MKKIMLLSLVSIFSLATSAQVINVPGKTQTHFQEKYKGATKIKWTNSVVSYQASFNMGKTPCKAHYSIDGDWTYTEWFVKKDSFPETVRQSFSKSKYRDMKVLSVAQVEYPKDPTLYRYDVKNGALKPNVFFNIAGELVKTNQ